MTFDQAKTLRLKQWRATLDDQDFRMQNPEGHRETLHEMAAALHGEGLIDLLERFDMGEMADAAYWHAVEELQNSPGQYRGASTYDVVRIDNGELLGTISRSIFHFATTEPSGASSSYDGKVYSGPEGIRLNLGLSPECRHDHGADFGDARAAVPIDRDAADDPRHLPQTHRRPGRLPSTG